MDKPPTTTTEPVELTDSQRQAIDQAMHDDKLVDGYARRNFQRAMELQTKRQAATGETL